MKVYYLLVSAFCVWIKPTNSQFFYSTHFSPVFPQTYLPPLPTFPAVAPLVYNAPQSQAPSTITYNLPPAQTAEYRGFGYRTDYKDGATSTVYYVTGPESETLRGFRDFPNFIRKVQETNYGKARSLASDITDTNAIPDAPGKIQSILQPAEFQRLFDDVMPGIINFYRYPAGTAPLGTIIGNITTTAAPSSAAEEAEVAESVVNARILLNDVESTAKPNETVATTTESHTTEAQTTIKASEVTTATTDDDATTLETTTQV